MTPRKGKLPAVLACMAALAGCNINPANQGSVSSWFSMRAGDPPSFVTGVVGFENTGSNDPSTRLTLRFRDPASKTHAAHVTTSSYSELFSLALTPRYYELYEFEVRYLSYTVTRETGAYEERCEANGEALEKTVRKGSAASPHGGERGVQLSFYAADQDRLLLRDLYLQAVLRAVPCRELRHQLHRRLPRSAATRRRRARPSSTAAISTTAPSAAIGWMPGWRR